MLFCLVILFPYLLLVNLLYPVAPSSKPALLFIGQQIYQVLFSQEYLVVDISLHYLQVFLMLCTLVTLYFADEVPLTVSQHRRLSDSAPLLDDEQQSGFEFSKYKPDIPFMDDINGKTTEDHFERNVNLKNENLRAGEHDENAMNGPGAVLVNFLTSLRHLPPAMNSVLIVMALTWVCSICAYFQSILITCYFLFS